MQTFWCEPPATGKSIGSTDTEAKIQSLVDWNAEILATSIRDIIARRNSEKSKKATLRSIDTLVVDDDHTTPLAEVTEIIELPEFDASINVGINVGNGELVELDSNVTTQLRDYVAKTAAGYNAVRKCIMQYDQSRRKISPAHLIILPPSVFCIQPFTISSMRLMS
jgi:hypothetical protein